MAELAGLLAFAAVKNNDRVGALLFTDRLERFVPPRKGFDHALAILRDALVQPMEGTRTDLALALKTAASLLKQRSVVFVLSDFLAAGLREAAEDPAPPARRRRDPDHRPARDGAPRPRPRAAARRRDGPDARLRRRRPRLPRGVAEARAAPSPTRPRSSAPSGVDSIPLTTDAPYERALVRFFKERERRRSAGR